MKTFMTLQWLAKYVAFRLSGMLRLSGQLGDKQDAVEPGAPERQCHARCALPLSWQEHDPADFIETILLPVIDELARALPDDWVWVYAPSLSEKSLTAETHVATGCGVSVRATVQYQLAADGYVLDLDIFGRAQQAARAEE